MNISLVQKQMMSQRMIQSTEILSMNTQELVQFVRQQELENPLIELKDKAEHAERGSDLQRKLEWLEWADEQNRVYYQEDMEEEEVREDWNVSLEEGESLAEYVFTQLTSPGVTAEDEEILYYMVNSLDDNGYLTEDLKNLRKRFGISETAAYRYLYLLQSAEPAGVGARNLRECLLIQLDRLYPEYPMARNIVLECLEELGQNRVSRIRSRLGISLEEAKRCSDIVRRLNPKPGRGFCSRENLRYIQPDVTVIKFRDYFQVMVNENSLPRIQFNSYYMELEENSDTPEDAREYLSSQRKQAEWICHCIRQRSETLAAVTREIVSIQRSFFDRGPGNRCPMGLQDLADRLGFHESTVSRAIRDKYVQCTWGVYPLNYFLTRTVSISEEGCVRSNQEQVRKRIRQVVDEEDKTHPLSDQKITDRLAQMGVHVSRRTVTKYRIGMGIREAGGRREWKD